MLAKSLREKLKFFTEFLARPIAALGIPANAISFMGVLFAIVALSYILRQELFPALVFSFLAISVDLFDGAVARLQGKNTPWGNYFETMMDKAVMTLLLAAWVPFYPLAGALALSFSWLASYAKPRAGLVIITDNRDWPGIGEHGDKMLLYLLGLGGTLFWPQILGQDAMELALYLIALVSCIGWVQRMMYAKKLIGEAEEKGTLLPYLDRKKNWAENLPEEKRCI